MQGFRIGFKYGISTLQSVSKNLLSVSNNPEVVQHYIEEEVRLGRLIGPLPQEVLPVVHCSPIGIIPKQHKPGKWWLIHDLSSPKGASVNDGILADYSSLSYVSVDQVIQEIVALGPGTLLAKLDIRSAYRIVLVHNDDRRLLGLTWNGGVYVDSTLPFGLRSAPKIFNVVADALQWATQNGKDHRIYHYLDDFICIGAPSSKGCRRALADLIATCKALGIPIATEKLEGPSTTITFLGIELDTESMQIRLPQEKLERLMATINHWLGWKACKKRELQSVAGLLQHASTVIRPGRCFVHRVYKAIALAADPEHWIHLNVDFRSDIMWWHVFAQEWNGSSMLWNYSQVHPDIRVYSDAAGNWGCGAWSMSCWLQVGWSGSLQEDMIHVKELIPIIFAAAVWGKG